MDNVEMKIRKGQAMNLAIQDAIALKKIHQEDATKYIYQRAMHYIDIIEAFQQATLEEIKEILDELD